MSENVMIIEYDYENDILFFMMRTAINMNSQNT